MRWHVSAVADDYGIEKVLMKVVDVFDDAVLHGGGDPQKIKHGEVLDVLAKAYSPGVRTNWHLELRGEKQDREVFVDAGDATAVNLAELYRFGLQ